jgi:hypothetical protein
LKPLANFNQPIVNHDPEFNAAPRLETTHEICASGSAALEQDKEVDQLCAILKEPDGEQDYLSAALEVITTAADSEIGPKEAEMARQRVLSQIFTNDRLQTVKAFAHVGPAGADKHADRGG